VKKTKRQILAWSRSSVEAKKVDLKVKQCLPGIERKWGEREDRRMAGQNQCTLYAGMEIY
jgi:hypothetical protein